MNEFRIRRQRQQRPAAEVLEVRSLLSAGLDPSFVGGGSERIDLPGQYVNAASVLNQYDLPGGKTLLVIRGNELTTLAAGGTVFERVLVRLNPDGTPDASFGVDGVLIAKSGTSANYPDNFNLSGSALQADGKLLLFGTSGRFYTGGTKPAAVRLNPDGSVDPTFHLGGSATGVPAVTPSGGIYVVRTVPTPNVPNYVTPILYRLNSDGSVDTQFGPAGDGSVTLGESVVNSNTNILLVAQGESALIAVNNNPVSTLFRYLPDGTLDPAFGANGSFVFDSEFNSANPGRTIKPSLLALDPQGRIIVVGETTDISITPPSLTVIRLDASGRGDASFNGAALASITFAPRQATPQAVGFTSDGKITLVASVADLDGRFALGLARLNSDGSADTSIGPAGTTIVPLEFFEATEQAHVDPQGRIDLARIGSDALDNAQAVVERVLPILPMPVPVAPGVTAVTPVIVKRHITGFVVSFRTPMSPSAGQLADYRLVAAGRDGRLGTRDDLTLHPASAQFDAVANVVRIRLRHPLPRQSSYRLTAFAADLTDLSGHQPSMDFLADFRGKV